MHTIANIQVDALSNTRVVIKGLGAAVEMYAVVSGANKVDLRTSSPNRLLVPAYAGSNKVQIQSRLLDKSIK